MESTQTHTHRMTGATLVHAKYNIKITVVRCLSVTEGHQKRFDLKAPVAVYLAMEHTKLELGDLCEQQS